MGLFGKKLTGKVSTFRLFGRTVSSISADEELRDTANQIAEAQKRTLDPSRSIDYLPPVIYSNRNNHGYRH